MTRKRYKPPMDSIQKAALDMIFLKNPEDKHPCKDCPNRSEKCHGWCEAYLSFSRNHRKFLDAERRERESKRFD